jgi:hypothetical protein
MTQQGSARSKDPARSHPQGHVVRTQRQWVTGAKGGGEPRPNRILNLLGWLMLPCLIVMTMQACGWMSLLGAKALIVEDTRARIQADYSPWPSLSFLPVDYAILEEISEDTGRSINVTPQDSASPSSWENPTPAFEESATGEPTSTPLYSETPTAGPTSPTVTMEGTDTATPTSTPATTSTATIPPTITSTTTPPPSPTDDNQGNQHFNYTSTPEPPKSTPSGNTGSGADDQSESVTRKN